MNDMLKKEWNKKIKSMFTLKEVNIPKVDVAPYRDWRTVVIIFFVVLVLSLGFNAYIFLEINSGSFFVTTPKGAELTKFDSEGLTRVLDDLLAKEVIFEKLKNESVSLIDPSI